MSFNQAPRNAAVARILLTIAVTVAAVLGVVTATGATGGPTSNPFGATLTFEPASGAGDVIPTAPVSVTIAGGQLNEVVLQAAGGAPIAGQLAPDKRSWRVTEPLGYAKTYTWSGTATDSGGNTAPISGSFTTVKPVDRVNTVINIGDNQQVGVGAPITLQFYGHVADQAAVQKVLNVQTSNNTEGAWGWLPDSDLGSRVHWRPKDYWKPGTKVTVTAKTYGVPFGGGNFGGDDLSSTFTIGRAQIVKADVNSHQMVVLRDGVQVASYPASYGLDTDPDRNTRSGIHVVTEKFTDVRMTSQRYQYDVVEKWAVRINNNGEFIHANPATTGVQGSANVSHGCVNLSTTDAKAYYDAVLYGDPVEVTGSSVRLSQADGDIWDWTLSWDQWSKLSAL
jgi:lipoprotein-anchoring transpeptidase ErfK/SrfK